MNGEFVKGAYNKEEHNHTEWPLERLQRRGELLSESLNTIEHHPIRKADIQREIGLIATEVYFRRNRDGK